MDQTKKKGVVYHILRNGRQTLFWHFIWQTQHLSYRCLQRLMLSSGLFLCLTLNPLVELKRPLFHCSSLEMPCNINHHCFWLALLEHLETL